MSVNGLICSGEQRATNITDHFDACDSVLDYEVEVDGHTVRGSVTVETGLTADFKEINDLSLYYNLGLNSMVASEGGVKFQFSVKR